MPGYCHECWTLCYFTECGIVCWIEFVGDLPNSVILVGRQFFGHISSFSCLYYLRVKTVRETSICDKFLVCEFADWLLLFYCSCYNCAAKMWCFNFMRQNFMMYGFFDYRQLIYEQRFINDPDVRLLLLVYKVQCFFEE